MARLTKWMLTATVLLALLLSSFPVLASSSANIASILPEVTQPQAETQNEEVCQITLITGDVVTVVTSPDGQRNFALSPAQPDRLGQHFLTLKEHDNTYIIPDGIDLEKLDRELFNIDYLVDEKYYNEPSLPLLVTYSPSLSDRGVQSLQGKITALGQETQLHEEVNTISTRLAHKNISASYNNLMSQPELKKIWLDKKVHAQLVDSIPLIGANSWWETTGNKGEGVEIAILDTGIDSSHPALDDLDDDPETDDPKVIVNVNFSDDQSFDDLFGHGTHCAGIAAGTDAGSTYQGVAPRAQLWNVKVVNQWGMGYESWFINGVNFASVGPDGVPKTGDEADVISVSLGWPPSDGTDPVSQAVNLAVERGVVVVVAAGNDGYWGLCTILSPGVAEKAITVGASDKMDNLADFSSLGPTEDLRIKPDILAPGVDITSSVPGGGYESHMGTSMATPHVAGAAALLQQYYGDTVSPQFIKDALMYTAKDLGYTIYEQGSGRLDLAWELWPKVGVTPASVSMGVFTSQPAASATLTFFTNGQTAEWHSDEVTELDLSVTIAASDGGGGGPVECGQAFSAGGMIMSSTGVLYVLDTSPADATHGGILRCPNPTAPVSEIVWQRLNEGLPEATTLDGLRITGTNVLLAWDNECQVWTYTDTCHDVTLTTNLIDVINGVDYSGSVTLNPASFTVPAGGEINVSLNIDLASLPASIYSGKVIATLDNDASKTIHAIFGFGKVRQVTVHKIDINGEPAQGHPVWVLMESPIQTMWEEWQETDELGNFIFYAIDGNYHLVSPNWGYEENQVTIWTIAENVAISGDMTINLDERYTVLVDFDPNKASQVAAGKSSTLRLDYHAWSSRWWYPSSFLTRVSPTSRFAASFSYNYYPEADFIPDNPELINTGEWHNLRYSLTEINADTTFVADYNNLVHRQTGYCVALNGERAEWAQFSWDDIGWWPFGFSYFMDAPQKRSEWLSPDPVEYYQWYAKAQPWGEWDFSSYYMSYTPGEYEWSIGSHPLTSGVDVGIWRNELDIYGPISKDSHNNRFYNQQAWFSGHITVKQDSEVVLEDDIWDSFYRWVSFEGTPHFTVEVWGETPLELSPSSYTRLDFTANPSHDYRPPCVWFWPVDLESDLYGVVPPGTVKVGVRVEDDSSIESVGLDYSLDDGETWVETGSPVFGQGYFTFELGDIPEDTFVTLGVEAEDEYGNHIRRETVRAFRVGVSELPMTVHLYEGATPIQYTGATTPLPDALTNISEITEIVWQRDPSTDGEWWFYFVEWGAGEITQMENGRVYIIVVSEDCIWELAQ